MGTITPQVLWSFGFYCLVQKFSGIYFFLSENSQKKKKVNLSMKLKFRLEKHHADYIFNLVFSFNSCLCCCWNNHETMISLSENCLDLFKVTKQSIRYKSHSVGTQNECQAEYHIRQIMLTNCIHEEKIGNFNTDVSYKRQILE